MKKYIFTLIILIFSTVPAFALEEIKTNANAFYLSDCIKAGIKNSPVLQNAYENMIIAKSDVGIAQAVYFPTIGTDVSYVRKFNSDVNYDDGNKSQTPIFNVYLQQLIYDFGKSHAKIKMEKFIQVVAENEYKDTVTNIVNDIRDKYFKFLLAKYAVRVEEDNVEINKKIVEEAKKKNELDYADAVVHLLDAELKLADAKNAYLHTKLNLENAMYITDSQDFDIKKIDLYDFYYAYFSHRFLEAPKGAWHKNFTKQSRDKDIFGKVNHLPFSLEEAKECAYENSTDLKALDATVKAMVQSLLTVQRQYYPNLSARVGYMYDHMYRTDTHVVYNDNQLNVAIMLNASLNGMKLVKELDKSHAIVRKAENDYNLMYKDLYYMVVKNYEDVMTEENKMKILQLKIDKSDYLLKKASSDYIAGRAGYVELQAARMAYNGTKLDYINEMSEYSNSLSNLNITINKNLDEICELADNILNKTRQKKYKKISHKKQNQKK